MNNSETVYTKPGTIRSYIDQIKVMVGDTKKNSNSPINTTKDLIQITKYRALDERNISELQKIKNKLLEKVEKEDKTKYTIEETEKYKTIIIPQDKQVYKLSDWRNYKKIIGFHTKKKHTTTNNLGCVPDTETWLSLDIPRALDYLDSEDLNNLIGMKTNKDLKLVICDDTIIPLLDEIYDILVDNFTNNKEEFQKNMEERYSIPNTIFGLDGKEPEEKSRFFINIFKFMFGIRGDSDLGYTKQADQLFEDDINMNVESQYHMLHYLNTILPNIIIKAADEHKENSEIRDYRKCCWWPMAGNLKTHQFVEAYMKKKDETNYISNKQSVNQRLSYLIFDRIAAYILCLGSTDPIGEKKFEGWYFPNNTSFWADGQQVDIKKNPIIDNEKEVTLKRFREKKLEEIMVWGIEKKNFKHTISKEAKLIGLIEYLIKNPGYFKERETPKDPTPTTNINNVMVKKARMEAAKKIISQRKTNRKKTKGTKKNPHSAITQSATSQSAISQSAISQLEETPIHSSQKTVKRKLLLQLEKAAASTASVTASSTPKVVFGKGIKRKKTKNKKKKPKRKTKQSNN